MNLYELFNNLFGQQQTEAPRQFHEGPMFSDGQNQNLMGLFRDQGVTERKQLQSANDVTAERMKQMKIQQLLEMLNMYPEMDRPDNMDFIKQYLNTSGGRLM